MSADDLRVVCLARAADSDEHARLALDLRDARAEIADLRAKLEDVAQKLIASEDREARISELDEALIAAANARADAAEAALREMTEQRDGAWKAGTLAMREIAADLVADKCRLALEHGWIVEVSELIRRLAPPAETAAKEERT